MCKLIFTSPLRTVLLAAASVKLTCVFALSVFQLCVLIINVITAAAGWDSSQVNTESETTVKHYSRSVWRQWSLKYLWWASCGRRRPWGGLSFNTWAQSLDWWFQVDLTLTADFMYERHLFPARWSVLCNCVYSKRFISHLNQGCEDFKALLSW